jgi:hypothetical protein
VRNTIILAALTLTSTLALAKAQPDKRAARRALDLNETGERREIELQVRTTVAPTDAHTTAGGLQPADHGPGDAPAARTEGAPLSADVLDEVVGRQMRRNVRYIEACLAEAQKRDPARAGQLTLEVSVVGRKVASITVSDDKVGDPAFADCLQKSGPAWTFSLSQARFQWPVTLGAAKLGAR